MAGIPTHLDDFICYKQEKTVPKGQLTLAGIRRFSLNFWARLIHRNGFASLDTLAKVFVFIVNRDWIMV